MLPAPMLPMLALMLFTLGMLCVAEGVGTERKIKVATQLDPEGRAKLFTLSFGAEKVSLDPGKSWVKTDEFKWVTRGLIEPPQSFHIALNGTVEINGEKILLDDPQGPTKLEYEINKSHVVAKPKAAASAVAAPAASKQTASAGKVAFRVHLDLQGHLIINCQRGADQAETGLRGVPTLIRNGFMLQPKNLHVDPLQKGIEIDGQWFEATEAGAQKLQDTLNTHYAAAAHNNDADTFIEVKENPASSTGFDIRFVTVHVGARFEVKGHLGQDKLDILQDPFKCDLLQPGIVLRLSPPNLLIRRRRPDGGEEKIPELPDVQYRRLSEVQFQQILNHPAIHKSAGKSATPEPSRVQEQSADVLEIRLTHNSLNPTQLWLECVTNRSEAAEGKAFTHHNLEDLQHRGLFQAHLEVTLSLDNRKLCISDKQTLHEESISLDSQSSDDALRKAGAMLTAALKQPVSRHSDAPPAACVSSVVTPPANGGVTTEPASAQTEPPKAPTVSVSTSAREPANTVAQAPSSCESIRVPEAVPEQVAEVVAKPNDIAEVVVPAPPVIKRDHPPPPSAPPTPPLGAPQEPVCDEVIATLFTETDSLRINTGIFGCLAACSGTPVLDVRLSLPRIFENRRFEIISFSHAEITSVLELRSDEFAGFYLSHINDQKVLFVYARAGKHLEWGAQRCLLESGVSAEPNEFKGNALLGLARDSQDNFVFIVTPAYKDWVKPHEKLCSEALARFLTVKEVAAEPAQYSMIWPEPPAAAAAAVIATIPTLMAAN